MSYGTKLPTHGFLSKKEVEEFTAKKIEELIRKGREGYLVEIVVEYPKELHENYN